MRTDTTRLIRGHACDGAFFTLAERQIMASMQRRFGPNVSGIGGVLQPFWDGLKLGVKEPILPSLSAYGAFSAAPMISFIISQISWCGFLFRYFLLECF